MNSVFIILSYPVPIYTVFRILLGLNTKITSECSNSSLKDDLTFNLLSPNSSWLLVLSIDFPKKKGGKPLMIKE